MTPHKTRESAIRELAAALVEAVTFDDSGRLVAGVWMGGNGGMLSRETIQAADKLRTALLAAKAAE